MNKDFNEIVRDISIFITATMGIIYTTYITKDNSGLIMYIPVCMLIYGLNK